MLEHQKALEDAERRVQEAEQRAVYRSETASPVKVQGGSGVECIARAVTIQGEPSGIESNGLRSSEWRNKRQSGLKRRSKMRLPLLEIAEHGS
jgi:hypothetical protein